MTRFSYLCRHALPLIFATLLSFSSSAVGSDFMLTIGGGYSPDGNQASIERNVIYYQRVLAQQRMDELPHYILFADGVNPAHDVQVVDDTSIPKANRLMAEFFGSRRDLGLSYRNHEVPGVNGETSPAGIRKWFAETGPTMQEGDRLLLYVTAHGRRSTTRNRPHDTSITLWNSEKVTVREMVKLLDSLPKGVKVVAIMVQCYAGGFAHFIYQNGDVGRDYADQQRVGFFATVHDRQAAGCTPEADETSYVEYSTYFWEALSGRTRMNEPIELPDYDGNGVVSFNEAHAYVVLTADTIDLPIKTSGEFLGIESGFRNGEHRELLPRNLPYSEILGLATPAERAVLQGLSEQLGLSGENRLLDAERMVNQTRRGRGRFSRGDMPGDDLRRSIAADLRKDWPELANLMNPLSIELVTTRSQEFMEHVEGHPKYARYRQIVDEAEAELSPEKKRVKYERFVRSAENPILRENLSRLKDDALLKRYRAIVELESSTLRSGITSSTAGR